MLNSSSLIGGHEGVGEVVAIGANTAKSEIKVGDRVGIKWLADSCLDCENCRNGREQSELFAPFQFDCIFTGLVLDCAEAKLSGFTVDGTFSEYVVSVIHGLHSHIWS